MPASRILVPFQMGDLQSQYNQLTGFSFFNSIIFHCITLKYRVHVFPVHRGNPACSGMLFAILENCQQIDNFMAMRLKFKKIVAL